MNRSRLSLSLVLRLLFHGCPSAIVGRVRAVVIFALNSQPCWTRPHVFGEGRKAFHPALTDFYSPASIIPVSLIFGICTALLHSGPDMPHSRAPLSVGLVNQSGHHAPHATATDGVGRPEIVNASETRLSAVAQTLPNHAPALTSVSWPDSNHAPESLPGNVRRNLAAPSLVVFHETIICLLLQYEKRKECLPL
jgi:hypothetical protein